MLEEFTLICPRCGRVIFGSANDSCMVCGYSKLIAIKSDRLCYYANNNDHKHFWLLSDELREQYLDKSNPAFSQEWCEKREAFDKKLAQNLINDEKKRLEYERKQAQEEARYVPRCPTCGSPHVHRIDKWESMYRKLQFECSKCGYQW